jgi:hypothetical protein
MLEPVAADLWTVTRPQRFWGLETGTRMTVARLSDGSLFVHCPVALDADTRRAVDALGPVSAIVASSLVHHLYAGQWASAYPTATLWGCPGLAKKRPDLPWTGVLGDAPDASWAADVDQRPLTSRFEREVVFFHRKSRTMVCADAMLNLWKHPSPVTRAAALLMGNLGPGRGYLERIAVRDWALGRQQVDHILEWDIDGVVLAHGALLAHGGRDALRDAYDWL